MKIKAASSIVVVALISALLPCGRALPSTTAPAFLWSPYLHHDSFSSYVVKDVVNYQTIYSKDIARSILTEGGWSNILCSGNKLQHPVDLALVFVGRELRSSDISAGKHVDSAIVDLLKVSFTRSKFSIAFPYIAASEEETMENLLVSGFMETCGHNLGITNVTFLGSCSVEDGKFQKLADLHSIHDYLVSRSGKRQKGQADLVVFCHGGSHSSKDLDQPQSEIKSAGEILSELINFVEQSGAKYAALYVSDPLRSPHYPSSQELGRFLAENASGNQSANSTICDEVCQIKSSLLEGLLVAIVLLIILISGICCMMGIDTPTRFETLQET
ncbi:uncharacterized protein LOC121238484 isoform X1 [Juglans microcarpa x Juglans regia]|uniref:uncharacterized protein LOC121238484 isoform X1 n=1 Tax=Juglans microcarpa x Juglans regia TaxID=2249226 RepID=UPI001B7E65B8|nr:uncharacterized protein LOC121238484 isoform X1 [Juglans microcarpa x Juglans regia]